MKDKHGSSDQQILGNTFRILCIALSIGGVVLSVVLTRGYFDHVVGGQVTGCAITSYVDCDKVSSSAFSTMFGVPLSVFGFGFHLFLISLLLSGYVKKPIEFHRRTVGLILVFTAVGALVSLTLAFISLVVIRALCIYCTALQIVNLAIFILVLLRIKAKQPGQPAILRTLVSLEKQWIIVPLAALIVAVAGSFFLMYGMNRRDIGTVSATGAGTGALLSEHFSDDVFAFTTDDSPTLGSNRLGFQIVVFSDYNCAHCKETDAELQLLVDYFEGKIELVFKFFPLSGECNPFMEDTDPSTSCIAAAAAYLAYEEGVFWEYHRKIFENFGKYSREQLIKYADEVGIRNLAKFESRLDDEFVNRRLYLDILEGVVAKVSYTPTVLLNGRRVESFRSREDSHFELIKDTIEEILESGSSQ